MSPLFLAGRHASGSNQNRKAVPTALLRAAVTFDKYGFQVRLGGTIGTCFTGGYSTIYREIELKRTNNTICLYFVDRPRGS